MKKSANIGKIINGFEVLDNYRKGKRTFYVVRCVLCGKVQDKEMCTVTRNQARCECNYKQSHHGMAGTKIYNKYQRMLQRCYNPNDKYYHDYGGRGISVCERWRGKNGFQNFYDDVSVMQHYGEQGYSLERIDDNGNYEPSNCKWATPKEQSLNTRRNVYYILDGERLTLSQCIEKLGRNKNTVATRLRRGKSIQEALEYENVENA